MQPNENSLQLDMLNKSKTHNYYQQKTMDVTYNIQNDYSLPEQSSVVILPPFENSISQSNQEIDGKHLSPTKKYSIITNTPKNYIKDQLSQGRQERGSIVNFQESMIGSKAGDKVENQSQSRGKSQFYLMFPKVDDSVKLNVSLTPQIIPRKLNRDMMNSQIVNRDQQYLNVSQIGALRIQTNSDRPKMGSSINSSQNRNILYSDIIGNQIKAVEHLQNQDQLDQSRLSNFVSRISPTKSSIFQDLAKLRVNSPNLMSKNRRALESGTSMNMIFSPKPQLRDGPRRNSKMYMIPSIKGIVMRKHEEPVQIEFIKKFNEINTLIKDNASQHQSINLSMTPKNQNLEANPNAQKISPFQLNQKSDVERESLINQNPLYQRAISQNEGGFLNQVIQQRKQENQKSREPSKSFMERFRPHAINIKDVKASQQADEEEDDPKKRFDQNLNDINQFRTGTVKVVIDKKQGHDLLAVPGRKTNNMQIHSPIKLGRSLFKMDNIKAPDELRSSSVQNSSNNLVQKFKEQHEITKKDTLKHKKKSNQKLVPLDEEIKEPSDLLQRRKEKKSLKRNESDEVIDKNSLSKRKTLQSGQRKFETSKNLGIYKIDSEKLTSNINSLINKARKISLYQFYNKSPFSEMNVGKMGSQIKAATQLISPYKSSNNMSVMVQEDKPKEESFNGCFLINRRNKKGTSIFGQKQISDQVLFDFLIYMSLERVISISIPNACFSDGGATILFQYLNDQHSLNTLKVYNNVMMLVGKEKEIPYLLTGTIELARSLQNKFHLQIIEIHGFFLHHDDLSELFESLETCYSLKKLCLSNNNIQDYGVEFISKFIRNPRIKLESLTLYNNNIGDEGAIMIADAFYDNEHIREHRISSMELKRELTKIFRKLS
eukprot:403358763